MATLTGQKISNSYKDLLQVSNDNSGIDTTKRAVSDGEGTASPLQLSESIVNINGTFQLNGAALTASASALNNITDLSGITGLVAVSGGNAYGRTLSGTAPVSISNNNGTEGNPTISLKESGITSATYGPSSKLNISQYGIVVSAETTTKISATTFEGDLTGDVTGDIDGANGSFSVAMSATQVLGAGATFTGPVSGTSAVFSGIVSAAFDGALTGNVTGDVTGDLTGNVTGDIDGASGSFSTGISSTDIDAATATFTGQVSGTGFTASGNVSAAYYYGDGSNLTNVPSTEGGTVKRVQAGTGINITVDGATSASIPVSGTVLVDPDQNFATVSVSTGLVLTAQVSGTGATFSGTVSAAYFDGDGSNLTNIPAATSADTFTVNDLTVVSVAYLGDMVSGTAAQFSGIVSATFDGALTGNVTGDIDGASGSFSTGISATAIAGAGATFTGAVTGTALTLSGNVTASAYWGDGSNLTSLPSAPTSVNDYTINDLTVVSVAYLGIAASGTAAHFSGIVSAAFDGALTGDVTGDIDGASGSFSTGISATDIDAATATFTGQVSGAGLTLSGIVSGTSGTFTGIVSAAFDGALTGNVTGDIDGASGSFSTGISATQVDGATATFTGQVSGAGLTLSGIVSGTSGTFTGIVSAAFDGALTGDVTGDIDGASGSFSTGISSTDIDAATATFTGQVSGVGLTLSGAVSGTSAVFSGIVSAANFDGGGASLTGVGLLASSNTWTVSQRNALTVDNDGSFDMDASNNFKCTPAGNIALTFTNHTDGQSGYILLINSGGHTISLHANTKADANLATTTTAAGTYIISYIDDGTDAYLTNSAVMA